MDDSHLIHSTCIMRLLAIIIYGTFSFASVAFLRNISSQNINACIEILLALIKRNCGLIFYLAVYKLQI